MTALALLPIGLAVLVFVIFAYSCCAMAAVVEDEMDERGLDRW